MGIGVWILSPITLPGLMNYSAYLERIKKFTETHQSFIDLVDEADRVIVRQTSERAQKIG